MSVCASATVFFHSAAETLFPGIHPDSELGAMADGVKCGLELLVTINVKRLCKACKKSIKELAVQGDWSSFIKKETGFLVV